MCHSPRLSSIAYICRTLFPAPVPCAASVPITAVATLFCLADTLAPPSPPNYLPLQDQNTLFLFMCPAAVSVVSGSVHCNMEGHAIHGKSLKLPILVVTNIHTINKYIPWPFASLKTTGPGDGRNDIVGGWYQHPGLNQHRVCTWSGRRARAEDRGYPRAAHPEVFRHCAEVCKAETWL